MVHELDRCARIEITRRGKPVAVVLSMREFERLSGPRRRFWDAYQAFRESVDLSQLGIEPSVFEGVREQRANPGGSASLAL